MKHVSLYYSSRKGINTGRGGAYFSLLAYKESLKHNYICSIIHQNNLVNTILDNHANFEFGNENFIFKCFKIIKYFIKFRPKIFISFSSRDFTLLFRLLCFLFGCKYIYIRAGGSDYALHQFYENVIFFHKENQDFCKSDRVKKSYLVSNRVEPVKLNTERLKRFSLDDYSDYLKVVRISRLNKTYYEVFLCTIKQHLKLQNKGVKVLTHLIGFPEDPSIEEVIRSEIKGMSDIYLFSEDDHTVKASELIPLYDVVVGIGRGFWEGVAYKKMVLGYSKYLDLPILLNAENMETFKHFNFSTRTVILSGVTLDQINLTDKQSEDNKNYIDFLHKEFDNNYSALSLEKKLDNIFDDAYKESLVSLLKTIKIVFQNKLGNAKSKFRHMIM